MNQWFTVSLQDSTGELVPFTQPTSKIVCVGRNYIAHAKELNNPIPDSPILFIKPNSCLVNLPDGVKLPITSSSCHHELEVAILVGQQMSNTLPEQVADNIAGIGLGLDLTLREIQSELKAKGQPWEKAKSFDGACPVSPFIAYNKKQINLDKITFQLIKNGQVTQTGNTNDMLFKVTDLVATISQHFTLYPGDIVLTGTPAGVGELHSGDQLVVSLNDLQWSTAVI
ncbi:fumarylacetoacetate hydrolase family protein [Aliikangiella maris]|uniref:Fumarylacetoacetate hydrolase family protein n=2 Tax=Aliikangiella maris TaxID=3162458 RepID=A0ABV3ML03_9GAMM